MFLRRSERDDNLDSPFPQLIGAGFYWNTPPHNCEEVVPQGRSPVATG